MAMATLTNQKDMSRLLLTTLFLIIYSHRNGYKIFDKTEAQSYFKFSKPILF
jgi:hypothetical protein